MEDYKKMYEELKKEFEQYKKESIKWSVEDFVFFNHSTHTINDSQAQEALEYMIKHHDADLGISWYNVNYCLELFGTKK